MKKILFGLSALALFAACTEDYTDWAQPQSNAAVPTKTVVWTVAAAQQGAIALDDIQGETVKLLNITLPEGATAGDINVKLTGEGTTYDDYNITADASGNVAVADLQKAVTEMYTIEAVERTFNALVSTDVVVKGVEGDAAIRLQQNVSGISVIPQKPQFSPFVYFIGATDGWSKAEQKLACPGGDGLYTGFVYCADPNGWGVEFKFQRVAGSWDNEINSGTFTGGITGDFADGGGNIKAAAGVGVYYVELDLAKATLKATFVQTMSLIGDFNSWSGDVDMTWNDVDFCYEVTNPGITASGWKFRVNHDWGNNLGGKTLTDLTNGGDNLSAVGNTVKLYPTRRDSDKIYCTVE